MGTPEPDLLDDLSDPDEGVVETLRRIEGDLLLLGAGGKIGHGLAVMAHRALERVGRRARVLAVSRFRDPAAREALEAAGIATAACDLADPEAVERLPEASDVVYLAGQKFGTSSGQAGETWVLNSFVPGLVARRLRRGRFAVYSSGNVYPFWPAGSEGPSEEDAVGPVGEYAQSVVARERIFEHFSRRHGTRAVFLRLNYANEPRYGVLVDLAARVLAGEPVDLTMGWVNVVWQGDANRAALRALDLAASPPAVLNLAGAKVSVREAARELGRLLGREPRFSGAEAPTALLSNGSRAWKLFGPPRVDPAEAMRRIAHWVKAGNATWGKPTHFEVRDGRF